MLTTSVTLWVSCQHTEHLLCTPWGNLTGIPHRTPNSFPKHLRTMGVSSECSACLRSYKEGMSPSNHTKPTLDCHREMLATLSLGKKWPESLMDLFFMTKVGKSVSGFLKWDIDLALGYFEGRGSWFLWPSPWAHL